MGIVGIVLRRDFKEIRQTNAFRILVIASAVITAACAVGVSIALGKQAWLGEEVASPIVELIIGLITYFLTLFILISFIWAFAGLPIVKEKVNGVIECLIATPLSPKKLWMGKCLAILLPGYAISVVATLVVVLAVNLTTIIPAVGYFILPVPVLLTSFFINPLLFFGLLAFMVIISLANNPDIAIAPSFIIGFGLMMGLPIGIATGTINLASWAFALWYFVGTVIIWVIVGYLTRLLTKENIVLSSKGD